MTDKYSNCPDIKPAMADSALKRLPYERPQLLCFGNVADLTRGSSGSGNDGGPAYMNRRPTGPWCDQLPWLPWCR